MLLKHFSRREKQTTFVAIGALSFWDGPRELKPSNETVFVQTGQIKGIFLIIYEEKSTGSR